MGVTVVEHTDIEDARRHDDEVLADLVRRARDGNHAATVELMRRCRPFVVHTARRYLSNVDDVDDVVQEVWVSLLREVGRIRSPELIRGWLKQVTAHAAIRVGTRSKRIVTGRDMEDMAGDDNAEDDGVEDADRDGRCIAVRDALCRLRAADRVLVERLMAVDRPNYRAIGQELERPVGSLGPTRQRILARLREDPSIARLRTVA